MTDDGQPDFVWRFRLDEVRREPGYDDPLLELLRSQWEELLKLCIPKVGDKTVTIDGFALMREPDQIRAIYREDLAAQQRAKGDRE